MIVSIQQEIIGYSLDELRALMDPAEIAADISTILRKSSLVLMRNLIRTCSVDTGRARAGFLALTDKYGVSAADVMAQPSPYQTAGFREPASQTGEDGMSEGRRQGTVRIDDGITVEVSNSVQYVEFINSGARGKAGTLFMDIALVKLPDYLDRVFDYWVETREQQSKRVTIQPSEGPGDMQP